MKIFHYTGILVNEKMQGIIKQSFVKAGYLSKTKDNSLFQTYKSRKNLLALDCTTRNADGSPFYDK